MTAIYSTASTLLVALDISKHRHEVLVGIPGKKRRRRLTITNTLEDFRRLAHTTPTPQKTMKTQLEFFPKTRSTTAT